MQEVLLHIGMHKTGSSSIQESLNGYDDGSTVYANLTYSNHSLPIFTIFSSNRNDYYWKSQGLNPETIKIIKQDSLNQFIRELKNTDRKRLIISGEDIGYLSSEEKKELIVFLKQYTQKIKVICYIRSPLSFTCSAFSEFVKAGQIPVKISTSYKHMLEVFRDDESIDVHLKIFDKEKLFNGDVIDDFCELLNLNSNLIKKRKINISYSEAAIKIIYKFLTQKPCVIGDSQVNEARVIFFEKLASIYADYPALKKEYFSSFIDWEDASYLSERFKINFEWEISPKKSSQETLHDYLNDLSEVDLSRIDKELFEQNIQGNFNDFNSKLNRLFYNYVSIASLKNHFSFYFKSSNKSKISDLPMDFNGLVYLILNPDLVLARVDPQQHYLEHGRVEGRQYKA